MVASEPCTHPPTHLAAVGAVAAPAASDACLVEAKWCPSAWFLGSIDAAGLSGLCILNRMVTAFQLQCLAVGGS